MRRPAFAVERPTFARLYTVKPPDMRPDTPDRPEIPDAWPDIPVRPESPDLLGQL